MAAWINHLFRQVHRKAFSLLKLIESFRKSSQSSYSGSRADPLVKRKSLEKTSCLENRKISLVSRAKVANRSFSGWALGLATDSKESFPESKLNSLKKRQRKESSRNRRTGSGSSSCSEPALDKSISRLGRRAWTINHRRNLPFGERGEGKIWKREGNASRSDNLSVTGKDKC